MLPLYAPASESHLDHTPVINSSVLEAEFVQRLNSGDRSVVEDIYKNYSSPIYGVIRRMVQDDQTADGVLQRTFAKLYECLGSYTSSARIFTWLVWTAGKESFTELHRQESVKAENIQPKDGNRVCLKVIHTAGEGAGSERAVAADRVEPKYRMILNLVYFQGFSAAEVAERFAVPLDTIKSYLARAIRQLRSATEPAVIS